MTADTKNKTYFNHFKQPILQISIFNILNPKQPTQKKIELK
jgi:hypothetical protein